MATELTFAKTFLSLLDSKPPKISPDHVEDPRNYPGSSPYTLPRHPTCKPFSKPAPRFSSSSSSTAAASQRGASPALAPGGAAEAGIAVTLRSPRNPAFDLALPAQDPTTSLAELKERVASETGIPFAKIKLLHGKKPVADSRLLRELVAAAASHDGAVGGVELGVMVLGGAAAVGLDMKRKKKEEEEEEGGRTATAASAPVPASVPVPAEDATPAAPVAQGLSGEGVLETGQFWEDLKGFLQQRVRDEGVAGQALGLFRGAWEGRMV